MFLKNSSTNSRIMMITIFLLFSLGSLTLIAHAQIKELQEITEIDQLEKKVKENKIEVKLKPFRVEKNSKNLFQFDVVPPPNLAAGPYNVLYYVDDRYVTEFKNVSLPYSFKRNLNGVQKGKHRIRIDIENMNIEIVGSQTVDVIVR